MAPPIMNGPMPKCTTAGQSTENVSTRSEYPTAPTRSAPRYATAPVMSASSAGWVRLARREKRNTTMHIVTAIAGPTSGPASA